MAAAMAQLIEFYVPETFRRQGEQRIPPEQRGTIIPFSHPNRSPYDMKTLRLVHAPGESDWHAERGFCAPGPDAAYLDW
jgi:hypothetical protein